MDVRLYGRVISRYRYLVAAGAVIAIWLTFLAIFKVDAGGIAWRQGKTYQATSKLLLTNLGGSGLDGGTVITIDAEVANSDAVRILAFGTTRPLDGTYAVNPVFATGNFPLPILQIDGFASTPQQASRIAARVTQALRSYLPANVEGNGRVSFTSVSAPDHPFVAKGRRMTVPILIFLSVLIITLALAFLLENLNPRPIVTARNRQLEPVDFMETQLSSSGAADAGSPNGGEDVETAPRSPARQASRE